MMRSKVVKEFGMFKRIMPSYRLLLKHHGDAYKSPIPEWIAPESILRQVARKWPEVLKEKLYFFGISPKLFTLHLKGGSHITLYEMYAIADILDCDVEINLIPKKSEQQGE